MILDETFALLKTRYENRFNSTRIEKVQIGVCFAAVQLSSGYCGLSSVDSASVSCCTGKRIRENLPFTPGNICGQKLLDLFSCPLESRTLDIVRMAAMNAVSQELIASEDYTIVEDKDPIELVDLQSNKIICIVGAFHSYIKTISQTQSTLVVIEMNELAIPDEYKQCYVPASKAASVFPEADTIIITGSTLVNRTLDFVVEYIPSGKQVILVGPTAGLIPDVLLRHGIQVIGATRVADPERVMQAIAEGAAGYHLFRNGAQKICIMNNAK